MISKKVDIIIPVYNKVDFVYKITDSLSLLPVEYFNIIFIDDGSKDDFSLILSNLISERNLGNFYLFQKENGGVSSARNLGLRKVKSEYIWFVDPDDMICEDEVLKNLDFIKGIKEDIIVFNYIINDLKNYKIESSSFEEYGLIDKKTFLKKYDPLTKKNKNINLIWNKWYKREFIGNYSFDESLHLGEDRVFNLELFSKSGKVYICDIFLYQYYFYGENTLSTSLNVDKVNDMYKVNYVNMEVFGFSRDVCKAHIIEQTKAKISLNCKNVLTFYINEHKKLNINFFPFFSIQELLIIFLLNVNMHNFFYRLFKKIKERKIKLL